MIEYFDSHCHLTDAAFREDREAVFRRSAAAGVTRMVCIASSIADSREAIGLVAGRTGAWCTVGVHPHEAGGACTDDPETIRDLAKSHPDIVAVGETGLDYYYDNAPRAAQRASFDRHLEVAAELGLPVVVHAREADADIAAALRGMPVGTRGVLHCFTGGEEAFAQAMDADWYVSFSGIASFKSFDAASFLREVPPARLMIETDAPYLAPVPHRGRRNEPAHVIHVAEAVANHLSEDVASVARRTTENACRFYGIEG